MELIFHGDKADIEKFLNEIIYPVIRERQRDTEGHYFRITEDNGEYVSRKPEGMKVRRIRGYFYERYYPDSKYAGMYSPEKLEESSEE